MSDQFFVSIDEFRRLANDVTRRPMSTMASMVLTDVLRTFMVDWHQSGGLPVDVTPEMLEACIARIFEPAMLRSTAAHMVLLVDHVEVEGPVPVSWEWFEEQRQLLQSTAEMAEFPVPSTDHPARLSVLLLTVLQTGAMRYVS